jgi:large subunit ribosomal protein L24
MNQKHVSHLKNGDTIKEISGREKGKIGEITKILRSTNQVVIKEINIKKKHIKPKKEGDIGRISQFEAPIDISNVMLYSTEQKIASRIGMQINSDGTKVRLLKKLLKVN